MRKVFFPATLSFLKFTGATVACLTLAISAAQADVVVNIDFGNAAQTVEVGGAGELQQGLAAAPDAAGASAIWNSSDGNTSGLVDSTGLVTTLGVTFDGLGPNDILGSQELAATGTTNLFRDYLGGRAGDSQFNLITGTVTGLDSALTYDLYFYGQGDNFTDTNRNGGQNTGFRIGN